MLAPEVSRRRGRIAVMGGDSCIDTTLKTAVSDSFVWRERERERESKLMEMDER